MKPYIIAETAYNHEGEFEYLNRMIEEISKTKARAIKFHILKNIDTYFQKNHPLKKKLSKLMLKQNQWKNLIDNSKKLNLEVIVLCDDIDAFDLVFKNE